MCDGMKNGIYLVAIRDGKQIRQHRLCGDTHSKKFRRVALAFEDERWIDGHENPWEVIESLRKYITILERRGGDALFKAGLSGSLVDKLMEVPNDKD